MKLLKLTLDHFMGVCSWPLNNTAEGDFLLCNGRRVTLRRIFRAVFSRNVGKLRVEVYS